MHNFRVVPTPIKLAQIGRFPVGKRKNANTGEKVNKSNNQKWKIPKADAKII